MKHDLQKSILFELRQIARGSFFIFFSRQSTLQDGTNHFIIILCHFFKSLLEMMKNIPKHNFFENFALSKTPISKIAVKSTILYIFQCSFLSYIHNTITYS